MKKLIRQAFDKSAKDYESVAKIQLEIGKRLFERLEYFKFEPKRILDLGCGSGVFTRMLRKKYPKAQVYGLDAAFNMLSQAKQKKSWRTKFALFNGDIEHLPFASGCFDLIFSNQVIHWVNSRQVLFAEIKRVLSNEGVFLFTTLGPDTFLEIKQAWQHSDCAHVNEFVDMHDVGDVLLDNKFIDPVMDMEKITLHYTSVEKLVADLKAQGVKNIHANRSKGLMGKQSWQRFLSQYPQAQTGAYPLTYEVVYGQACGSGSRKSSETLETRIPISQLNKVQKV